jgi:hypothetical protein
MIIAKRIPRKLKKSIKRALNVHMLKDYIITKVTKSGFFYIKTK